MHYSNRAINLRRGALVHVYDRYGAVYVLSLNRHQAAVIWGARDRNTVRLGRVKIVAVLLISGVGVAILANRAR